MIEHFVTLSLAAVGLFVLAGDGSPVPDTSGSEGGREGPAGVPQGAAPDTGTLTTRDGVRLSWRATGSGKSGIVVPGAWILAGRLGLSDEDRRVVFYDMRSRGRSPRVDDPERLGLRLDVRDLEDVRRHFDLERISLVGFSYLGGVVARYAMEHPGRVDRLVLLGSIPPRSSAAYVEEAPGRDEFLDPERLERLQEMRDQGMEETDPVAYCRAYWRAMLPLYTAGPEAAARLAEDLDLGCELPNERPPAFLRVLGHISAALANYDWRDDARSLHVPVLVLHGTSDHVAPPGGAREWASVLPDARFEAVEEAGHLLWAERPGWVREQVTRFLAPGPPP